MLLRPKWTWDGYAESTLPYLLLAVKLMDEVVGVEATDESSYLPQQRLAGTDMHAARLQNSDVLEGQT